MKVGLVSLCGIGEQRELRHAEHVAADVLDAALPHAASPVVEHLERESMARADGHCLVAGENSSLGARAHLLAQLVDVGDGVVCSACPVQPLQGCAKRGDRPVPIPTSTMSPRPIWAMVSLSTGVKFVSTCALGPDARRTDDVGGGDALDDGAHDFLVGG